MTDQTIPVDKVRELIEHFEGKDIGIESYGILGRFRALLPAQQPTTGLLGRWAKHDAYGDVVVISDYPGDLGDVWVSHTDTGEPNGATCDRAPLDSLTFPHQATKPEDVPVGEARLVNLNGGNYSSKNVVALKVDGDDWRTSSAVTHQEYWRDDEVTLVCPLVPERPVSDLQAKYDALEEAHYELDRMYDYQDAMTQALKEEHAALQAKYREAQERIKTLEQASTPRIITTPCTVTTPEEYDALPVGSQVRAHPNSCTWERRADGLWRISEGAVGESLHDSRSRTVLRYGWGDEQPKPAWRIEHGHTNLRAGEYIIDKDGDTGTVHKNEMDGSLWCIGMACIESKYSPFIVFPNVGAATPEAVAEATEARDKETGE